MRLLLSLLLFILSAVIMLLYHAPATLLDKLIQHYTQQQFSLAEAKGSIWQGQAIPALRMKNQQLITLEPIRWQIDLSQLPKGQLLIDFRWHSQPQQPMLIAVNSDTLEIKSLYLKTPARLLSEAAPLLKPALLGGELIISSHQLSINAQAEPQGAINIDWLQASSGLASVSPLGDYQIQLNAQANKMNIKLHTNRGKLTLQGNGSIQGGRFQFSGSAAASADSREQLKPLLHHLGPRIAPGKHRLNIKN